MKKRRGSPCKHRYSGTCKSPDKVQTSSAHAVEEWTPCCHRLLVEFLNLQVLNTVEVPDNQRLSFYDYFLFSFCFLFQIFKGFMLRFLHHPPSGHIDASRSPAPSLHPQVDTCIS